MKNLLKIHNSKKQGAQLLLSYFPEIIKKIACTPRFLITDDNFFPCYFIYDYEKLSGFQAISSLNL